MMDFYFHALYLALAAQILLYSVCYIQTVFFSGN